MATQGIETRTIRQGTGEGKRVYAPMCRGMDDRPPLA